MHFTANSRPYNRFLILKKIEECCVTSRKIGAKSVITDIISIFSAIFLLLLYCTHTEAFNNICY